MRRAPPGRVIMSGVVQGLGLYVVAFVAPSVGAWAFLHYEAGRMFRDDPGIRSTTWRRENLFPRSLWRAALLAGAASLAMTLGTSVLMRRVKPADPRLFEGLARSDLPGLLPFIALAAVAGALVVFLPVARDPPVPSQFGRSLQCTRRGRCFTALTLGVGFVGINTGSDTLLTVLGALLGLIVASGLLSELSLRRLRAAWRTVPAGATDPAPAPDLFVINEGRFPAYALEVRTGRRLHAWRRLLVVPPRGEKRAAAAPSVTADAADLRWVCITTDFPFGFFKKSALMTVETEGAKPAGASSPPARESGAP
jgi:hypothetical protein